ncbi:DctP family TRAP transporter solute-binding subunit [Acuticoccus sp. M5D2P5]|uniref:DctP family TRAP transporter solute-binding subunit n=1 Tax=Acuticoccus kalidii TaxID=2910977 RepID=UPI001F2C0D75|nr:DctP family TRAP transporter solute-binding subunit [Acuticoccus kalidii]MCF3934683.1 DctP family TRAP transporter solute-binding subunit [Acuticoccus kalidii]
MKTLKTLAVSALAMAVAAPALAQSPKVLRYAHFQAANLSAPKHAAALAFEGCVESKTAGSIDVQIFPASQLGDGNQVLEGLELGSIQMGVVHDGPVSSTYEPFSVLALPYVFTDQAMAWAIMDGEFGDAMAEDMLDQTGIRVLGYADNGVRNFTNSQREVKSPADMEGLKIRVQPSPVYVKLVEALGASATPVPWPELPTALQQGVVDGQENGVTNIVDASLYQHQKYVTLDGHVFSWHVYLISDQFYGSLSADEQKAVDECAQIAKTIHRGMTAAQDANASTILSDLGLTVTALSPDETAAFRDAAQGPVREWIVGEIGEEWPDRLDAAVEAYNNAE